MPRASSGSAAEERNDRHVLEQQDGERALAVVLLQLPTLFEDLQRDRGRRQCQRKPGDDGPAPVDQVGGVGESADHDGGQGQLRGAQTEYRATHRDQPPELELEADQEQQHDHAQLGDRNDALGRSKGGQSGRADDDAGNEIGDNGRQPDSAGNGHAQDRGGEQHQPECQEAEVRRAAGSCRGPR